MEVGLLTEIMNAFVDAFSGGFDRIRPAVSGLLHVLIGIEVAWFAVLFMLGMESVSWGLKKIMAIGMWTFVALRFDQHALALVDSLVRAGMLAAGAGGQSARTLLNPSAILEAGFTATQPIGQQVLKATSFLSFSGSFTLLLLTWLLMMLAYVALAINAFMVMIEYYLAIAVVGILVPFGVLAPTRWIAMKPMGYFLSCGLKMMVISFLVAISRTVLTKIHFSSDEPTAREMWIAVCCSGMIGLLCWKAPDRLAQGFMVGAASFGGGDVARHPQAVAPGTARVAGTAMSALGGIAGATVAAGKALVAGYQEVRVQSGARTGAGSQGAAAGTARPDPLTGPLGGGAALARTFTASASGRTGAASKPPVLVPPSDTQDISKKE